MSNREKYIVYETICEVEDLDFSDKSKACRELRSRIFFCMIYAMPLNNIVSMSPFWLCEILVDSANKDIVLRSDDKFLGDAGQNLYGFILTEVRDKILDMAGEFKQ